MDLTKHRLRMTADPTKVRALASTSQTQANHVFTRYVTFDDYTVEQ